MMRDFFNSGITRNYDFRLTQLKNLRDAIIKYEDDIINALYLDLGKCEYEGYASEVGIVLSELNHAINNLYKWMKPKRVYTPFYLQPSTSYIYTEPKGVVLIISPWNYPFQLSLSPLIGAIAAGNCIILKPSHKSFHTESIIYKLINETFEENYIKVVKGPGSETVERLIKENRFDHIFFTGSVKVGKKILQMAAENMTTVTLELGGKSPVIVHNDADVDISAKRIVWGKFMNAGQTCIAPDYVLVHESKKEILINSLKKYINEFYGKNPLLSKSYGRIINEDRFNRLVNLLKEGSIIIGGDYDINERYISPTIVDNVRLDSELMKEEIFGPILPILSYNDISEVLDIIARNPYPLALYLFTEDKKVEDYILSNVQFGGGCINHTLSHIINPNLPFGGFGYSGIGRYHSKYTFDTFSHEKSIFKAKGKLDPNIKYPPYDERKLKIIKKVLK